MSIADDEQGGTPDDPAPQACTVCRGTGTVQSNLGGTRKPQTCPWCEGSGVLLPEHDAQEAGASLLAGAT